jgi:uncharacterized pyridoxamine 5'-phosphate oxidase family protein
MLISIDFDGTLCDRVGIPRTENWMDSNPVKYALPAMEYLKKQGHKIYILTARRQSDFKDIKIWLKRWGFPEMEVTNKKKKDTAVIIDDRAIRFENNWMSICKYFG